MADNRQAHRETPVLGAHGRPGGNAMARFSPREKAKNAKGTFKKLLKFYVKEAKLLFLVSGLLLIAAAAGVFAPYLIGRSVDAMTGDAGVSFPLVYKSGAALLTIYLTVWILNTAQGLIMNRVSQRIVRTLRRSLFDKMQKLPLMFH
ncbi:MAG: multidrug ABC transporter ATP-binding protein, partial [Oscillospiraceae bacterium]|nr:multidrug ABC transporter ATP-binding protein [Oscillospiraceae bacterium]